MPRTATKRTTTETVRTDPQTMALRAAERRLASLLTSPHADEGGRLDSIAELERIVDVLVDDYVRDRGGASDDPEIVREMCALEAGYLVGVQVGLRLRGGL